MKIIVQKFGGTSVKDDRGRKLALSHIKEAVNEGYKRLSSYRPWAEKAIRMQLILCLICFTADRIAITEREQDMLLSCGETISSVVFASMLLITVIKAAALTGAQAGFLTR